MASRPSAFKHLNSTQHQIYREVIAWDCWNVATITISVPGDDL